MTADPRLNHGQGQQDGAVRRLGENTRAVHLPEPPVPGQHPLGTPVYRTAAFAFGSSAEYEAVLGDREPGGYPPGPASRSN